MTLGAPKMPNLGGDPWLTAVLVVAILTLGVAAWLWLGLASDRTTVAAELEQAVQDSARYADLIAQTTELEARRDSILERVAVIQEIDRDRLVWPHLLDEVARALPEYTWLTEITTISTSPVVFQLLGRAGNTRAITLFMEQLQASPFIRSVRLITSQAVVENENTPQQQVVQAFELEVEHQEVPLDQLATVPLFGDDEMDGAAAVDDMGEAEGADAPPADGGAAGDSEAGPVPEPQLDAAGGEAWR